MSLYTVLYNHKIPPDALSFNVTSWSKEWTRNLSPYFLGPVEVAAGIQATSIENAFQFSKLYAPYAVDGKPGAQWFKWAKQGWSDPQPIHYPMRKKMPDLGYVVVKSHDAKTFEYEMLTHEEARNRYFLSWYSELVVKTPEFQKLKEIVDKANKDVYLVDFEGYLYDREKKSVQDILDSPVPFGQAMVLSWLLEGKL